jgi:hypothetical protein
VGPTVGPEIASGMEVEDGFLIRRRELILKRNTKCKFSITLD